MCIKDIKLIANGIIINSPYMCTNTPVCYMSVFLKEKKFLRSILMLQVLSVSITYTEVLLEFIAAATMFLYIMHGSCVGAFA